MNELEDLLDITPPNFPLVGDLIRDIEYPEHIGIILEYRPCEYLVLAIGDIEPVWFEDHYIEGGCEKVSK